LACLTEPLAAAPLFPLKASANHRHLEDQSGRPFLVIADTPWFIQKVKLEDVRAIMDDRVVKGFNTLFLETVDDSNFPSRDGYGNVAFFPDDDITKPVDAYWKYGEQVMEEAEKRGLFVMMSSLWFGGGQGMYRDRITPQNAAQFGKFLAARYGRFKNLLWMGVGDMNPNARQQESARILGRTLRERVPHHLQTAHLANDFTSAMFFNDQPWLDVNFAYTYKAAYLHVLPEYQRDQPVRPVILSETGYEGEPNYHEKLPDGRKGALWNPFTIRRNAWWAMTSGATGFCTGSRMWRWEADWKKWLDCGSAKQVPLLRRGLESIAWWKLVPDAKHEFITAGFGEHGKADYATAALARDGSCAAVYLPTPRTFTLDLAKMDGPVTARWFDPTDGTSQDIQGPPLKTAPREFSPRGKNAAGDGDWLLLLQTPSTARDQSIPSP
jgi:hypothetical protein